MLSASSSSNSSSDNDSSDSESDTPPVNNIAKPRLTNGKAIVNNSQSNNGGWICIL